MRSDSPRFPARAMAGEYDHERRARQDHWARPSALDVGRLVVVSALPVAQSLLSIGRRIIPTPTVRADHDGADVAGHAMPVYEVVERWVDAALLHRDDSLFTPWRINLVDSTTSATST